MRADAEQRHAEAAKQNRACAREHEDYERAQRGHSHQRLAMTQLSISNLKRFAANGKHVHPRRGDGAKNRQRARMKQHKEREHGAREDQVVDSEVV